MKKKVVWILIIIIAGAAFVFFWIWRPPPETITYTIPRQIRYRFTVKNTTNQVIQNAGLWVYAPVKQTPTQICNTIETSHPYRLTADPLGNQILYFSWAAIPPYASKIVAVKADLLLSEKSNPIHSAIAPSRFLPPERYVEADHPDIVARAEKLKVPETLSTARAIFHWVAGHLDYTEYLRNERGAYYALSQRKGDCTEYMDLFTALCRASGIPCRRLGGYVCSRNTVLTATGYHNWAEFYADGKWHLADPQNNMFMEKADDYIVMRIISSLYKNELQDYNRFRVKGQGLNVKMH